MSGLFRGRDKGVAKTPGSGRKKGTRNSHTKFSLAKLSYEARSGEMPLEKLLYVMRDPNIPLEVQIDCAKAAAPYCHPRLNSVEANVTAHHQHTHSESVSETARWIAEMLGSGTDDEAADSLLN